jgi:hypothetical protein
MGFLQDLVSNAKVVRIRALSAPLLASTDAISIRNARLKHGFQSVVLVAFQHGSRASG